MRTKNEEERDRIIRSAVEAVSAERGAQGFTIDDVVARFKQLYALPPAHESVPVYEAETDLPEVGVTVVTTGTLYGQTADGTLVERTPAHVAVYRRDQEEPLYVRFIEDEPDDAILAARHASVVERVRDGSIRHDGTHLRLDDVQEQVDAFLAQELAAMIASGEAKRLAAQEEANRREAWVAKEAGRGDGSYMACLYPVLQDRVFDAFDLEDDDRTHWEVSLMAEAHADAYLEQRWRGTGDQS